MGLGLEWLLTGEGDPEGPDASVPVPELGQNDSEMANLRQRVKDLEKIVALQEEMLEKYRKAAEGNQMDKGGVSRPGHGQASGQ